MCHVVKLTPQGCPKWNHQARTEPLSLNTGITVAKAGWMKSKKWSVRCEFVKASHTKPRQRLREKDTFTLIWQCNPDSSRRSFRTTTTSGVHSHPPSPLRWKSDVCVNRSCCDNKLLTTRVMRFYCHTHECLPQLDRVFTQCLRGLVLRGDYFYVCDKFLRENERIGVALNVQLHQTRSLLHLQRD